MKLLNLSSRNRSLSKETDDMRGRIRVISSVPSWMLRTISKECLFRNAACMHVTQMGNSTTYNGLCIFEKYMPIVMGIQKWPKMILGRDGRVSPPGNCNMDCFVGSSIYACTCARQRQYRLLPCQEVKRCEGMVPWGWAPLLNTANQPQMALATQLSLPPEIYRHCTGGSKS